MNEHLGESPSPSWACPAKKRFSRSRHLVAERERCPFRYRYRLVLLQNGGVSDACRFLPPGSGPKRRSSLRKRRAAAAATADANSTAAQLSAIAATLSTEGVGARNGEGELSVARSMSPLLSELLNGKLGKTIAMFCRRAAEESRAARRRGCEAMYKRLYIAWYIVRTQEVLHCSTGRQLRPRQPSDTSGKGLFDALEGHGHIMWNHRRACSSRKSVKFCLPRSSATAELYVCVAVYVSPRTTPS